MPSLFATLSPWAAAALIFVFRVCDVSLGTMRTIAVVDGRIRLSVVLGFFEILIWVTALSEVIARIHDNVWLGFAFAGGFATGNAVGIALEKRLALGSCVVRFISAERGEAVAQALRTLGRMVTTFRSDDSSARLVYVVCSRRNLPALLAAARLVDPYVYHAVERFPQTSDMTPTYQPTGWRAVMKKK